MPFFSSQNANTASGTSRPAFVAEQLLFLGATTVVAAVGIVWLWRRRLRALALVPVIVTLSSYWSADAATTRCRPIPSPSPLERSPFEGWLRPGRRLLLPAVLVVMQVAVIVLAAPIVVPFYSTGPMVRSGVWKTGFFKDEIGWPEMTEQVERAWRRLSHTERAEGVVLAENYGEASALQFYGHNLGPVLERPPSWQYWRPPELPQRFALTVGYDAYTLNRLCRSWQPLARIENRWQLDNEERGRVIAACSLTRPLGSLWKSSIARNQL